MFRFLSLASVLGLVLGIASLANAQTGETIPSNPPSPAAQRPLLYESAAGAAVTPGPYLRLNSGYSFGQGRIDDSWIIGGGIGYRFSPNFRSDLTFDYRPDFEQQTNFGIGPGPKSGLSNWTAMLNGYYDFTSLPLGPLVPYIGAGLGIAQNSFDGVTVKTGSTTTSRLTGSEKNQFAWQAMAGVSYYFTPSLALDIGYRYVDAGESGLGNRLENNEVSAALRYAF